MSFTGNMTQLTSIPASTPCLSRQASPVTISLTSLKAMSLTRGVLRAYAMVDMEDWWGYEEKIVDPDLGVDDYDDGPNLDETILLTVI